MTALANMTVKKADGSTDVLWTGAVPSSGDKSPAVWENRTVGTAPAHFPKLSVTSTGFGPNGTIRKVSGVVRWPVVVEDANGRKTVTGYNQLSCVAQIDQNTETADISEVVKQGINLFDHADFVSQCIEGRAAT